MRVKFYFSDLELKHNAMWYINPKTLFECRTSVYANVLTTANQTNKVSAEKTKK